MSATDLAKRATALTRLSSARVARLATAAPDGRPHLIPVCFVLEGETLYSVVDEKPKATRRGLRRLRNIAANPSVALLADHYEEDWQKLWFVLAEGRAELVADEAEFSRVLAGLRAKYPQYRDMSLAFPTHPLIRFEIEKIVSWTGASAA